MNYENRNMTNDYLEMLNASVNDNNTDQPLQNENSESNGLVELKPESLTLYENNPYIDNQEDLDHLKEDILQNGLITPLSVLRYVGEEDNPNRYVLISGNRRLQAIFELKQEGYSEMFETVRCSIINRQRDESPSVENMYILSLIISANSATRTYDDAQLACNLKALEQMWQSLDTSQRRKAGIDQKSFRDYACKKLKIGTVKYQKLNKMIHPEKESHVQVEDTTKKMAKRFKTINNRTIESYDDILTNTVKFDDDQLKALDEQTTLLLSKIQALREKYLSSNESYEEDFDDVMEEPLSEDYLDYADDPSYNWNEGKELY